MNRLQPRATKGWLVQKQMPSTKARHQRACAVHNVDYKKLKIEATLECLGMRAPLGGSVRKKNREGWPWRSGWLLPQPGKEHRRRSGELATFCSLPWKVVTWAHAHCAVIHQTGHFGLCFLLYLGHGPHERIPCVPPRYLPLWGPHLDHIAQSYAQSILGHPVLSQVILTLKEQGCGPSVL